MYHNQNNASRALINPSISPYYHTIKKKGAVDKEPGFLHS